MTETWHGEAQGVAPPAEDTIIAPYLYLLSDCLCSALDDTPGGVPCFCGVVPGANVAMDYCDCGSTARACGMAWVRLDSLYPSRVFPQPATEANACRDPLAARIQLGVTRCLPGMDARGNPPSVAAQAEAVRVQMADMAAMRRAASCCFTSGLFLLGQYTPIGPTGNCGGGQWTVTVQVM